MRIPLALLVAGALLIGGAATGTTHAQWVDQSMLASHSVGSGAMSMSGSASPSSVSVTKGSSATTVVTLTDTSTAGAKNLVQRLTPTITGSLPSGVTAALTTRSSGICTASAQGAVATTPGGSVTTCLTVTVAGSATASNATVTVAIAGQQLRGGSPAGWTSSGSVSVPVTIVAPAAPSAPTISCGAFVTNGSFTFSWTAVSGLTYSVHRAIVNTDAGYSTVSSSASSPYTGDVATGTPTYWRVRATNAGGTSGFSNTLRLTRTGNGAPSHSCATVTP